MSKKRSNHNGIVYSTDPDFRMEEDGPHIQTLAPQHQKLRVRLDTSGRAGKTVTLIEGFTGTAADLETLGRLLKAHCGTGGSAKDGEIIVQGDQRDKITQWLKDHGYSATKRI